MKITRVNKDQLSTISELASKIWPVSYAEMISAEQIEYMLNLMYSKEELIKQIDSGHEFYILVKEDLPIGYLGIEIKESLLFIHKIYILPEQQGNAYGLKLIKYAERLAEKHNCPNIRLNVNRTNKAISFYNRTGFKIIKELDIDIGGGYYMNDYQMELIVGS